jgi:hypothetical protein
MSLCPFLNGLVSQGHDQFTVCAWLDTLDSSTAELLTLFITFYSDLCLPGLRCLFTVDRASHVHLLLE